MNTTFKKKNWIFLLSSIVIMLIGKLASPVSALSDAGNSALFLMIAVLVLLITESLPAGLIAIIGVTALPVLNLTGSLNEAGQLFGGQLFFYMLACFAISVIMGKLPISRRILYFFLTKSKKSSKGIISALLLTTALLSTFISDFPACLLMYIISKQYIQMIEDEKERKQTQKSLLLGLVIAVHTGGIATPIGNSITILASTFLAQSGYPVSFMQWMAFGVPIAVLSFPIALFLLFKIFPPVEQDEETRAVFIKKVGEEIPDKFSLQEITTLIILGITFACWIANFNLMMVTVLCGIALLFPGFNLLSWDEFNKGTSWNTVLLTSSLVAVISVLQSTGVIDWFLEIMLYLIPAASNSVFILLVFGLFTFVILLIIPNGPALMVVLGSIIIGFAVTIDVHPAVFLIGFACFSTFSYILPIDSLNLILYDGGNNFDAADMAKVGVPMAFSATVITAVWIPVCAVLLNFR